MIQVTEAWLSLMEKFVETGGVLMTIGGVDTGKSTFVRWACSELVLRGYKTALIDADTGQPDVGPPACISMAVFEKPPLCFTPKHAGRLHFLGAVSPVGHLLQGLTGVVKLARKAEKEQAEHILVNTTGWVEGGGAIVYKQAKIDALMPGYILALEKGKELAPILNPYRKTQSIRIIRAQISNEVMKRTRDQRRELRKKFFDDYFKYSTLIALKLDAMGISGLKPPFERDSMREQVVSLIDDEGLGRALGIIKDYNSRERVLEIATPMRDNPREIRRLDFQDFRLESGKREYAEE